MSIQIQGHGCRNIYKTTFIVPFPEGGDEYHTHFSLGPKVPDEVRPIAYDTHLVNFCNGHLFCGTLLRQFELRDIIARGLPIERVADWTEKETHIFSEAFCPQRSPSYIVQSTKQNESNE